MQTTQQNAHFNSSADAEMINGFGTMKTALEKWKAEPKNNVVRKTGMNPSYKMAIAAAAVTVGIFGAFMAFKKMRTVRL